MKFFYTTFCIAALLFCQAGFCQMFITIKATTSAGTVIQGSSTLEAHADEIEILSFANSATACATGNCQPVLKDLAFTLDIDKSTNLLRAEMFKGLAFQKVEVSFRKTNASFDFYKIKMEAVKITSMAESTGNGNPAIVFQVTFAPTRIGWIFNYQNGGGGAAVPVKFGWDFSTSAEWPSTSF